MALEIERKFLLKDRSWKELAGTPSKYRQGYIETSREITLRVRTHDGKGFLTIKGPSKGMARDEFEYEIPLKDARQLLQRYCRHPLIEKRRYRLRHGGRTWEIDEFEGENRGLMVAEVELTRATQKVKLPSFVAQEVTGDARYYNAALARRPFSKWPGAARG